MGKPARFVTVDEFRALSRLSKPAIAEAIRQQRFPVAMDACRNRLLIETAPALAWVRSIAFGDATGSPGQPCRQ